MSDFDTLVNKVISREGGYVNNPADRGGETKYGISKRAYPNLDIANLSREQAAQIYKVDYWDKIGADKLPENVRDLAFDTAVHHGAGTAQKWLAATGGDPVKLLGVRTRALEQQAAKDPSQQQFLAGWKNRLSEFGPVLGSPQAVPLRPAVPDWADRRAGVVQARRDEVLNRPGALVKLGAAMTNATTGRAYSAIREMMSGVRGEFDDEADYTFKPPKELLIGQSADRQAERLEARSARELNYIMDRQAEDDERMKVLASDGMWSGLAWGVAGEAADLSNWLAPLAASRLMGMKSAMAAAQGQKAATFGYATTENLIAGTAIEGTLQVLEQRPDPANFALAATVDIGVSLAQTGSLLRSARAFQGVQDAAAREVTTFEKAAANLGPGAKPGQVEAEYQRIRFEEIREPVAASIAPVPHRAKLMDDPDEVVDDGDEVFKTTEAPGAGVAEPPVQAPESAFKQEGDVFVAEFPNDQGGKGYIALREVDGRLSPSMVDNGLPPGQRSGKVVQAYEDAIEFAQQQGKQFASDDSVTLEAVRVYDALAKRGYAVEKNPNARLATKPEALTDRLVTDDGAPVYTVGAKGKSLQGPAPEALPVRQAIAKALESPALKVASETSRATRHLLTHLQKTLPAHVLDNVSVKFEGDVRGNYNPIDNGISAPGKSAAELQDVGYGNRNDANILAHEVVHAATGRLIAAVRDNVPGVTTGSRAAVQRLEEIRLELDAHLRAKGIRRPERKAGADYAAGDLDEFVAQVMSDVETRKALTELPAKGFKDLLSAFADAVIRLLGLDPKTNNSALKEAVALIDKIIREGEIVKGANAGNYIKTKPGLQAPVQNTRTQWRAQQVAAASVNAFSTDPIAVKYGLTSLPVATTAERAKAKAILNLYKKDDA